MSDYGSSTQTSPDGRYHVDFWEDEVRMNCWIRLPTITDVRDQRQLLYLDGQINSEVRFQFGLIAVRIWGAYSGKPFTLWLDPDQAIAWFEEEQQTKFAVADASARAQARIERNGWDDTPRPRAVRRAKSPASANSGPVPAGEDPRLLVEKLAGEDKAGEWQGVRVSEAAGGRMIYFWASDDGRSPNLVSSWSGYKVCSLTVTHAGLAPIIIHYDLANGYAWLDGEPGGMTTLDEGHGLYEERERLLFERQRAEADAIEDETRAILDTAQARQERSLAIRQGLLAILIVVLVLGGVLALTMLTFTAMASG
jgi:hypothetical protein